MKSASYSTEKALFIMEIFTFFVLSFSLLFPLSIIAEIKGEADST